MVDPPSAAFSRTALAKAARVRMRDIVSFSCTIATARLPASKASACRRASTAGMAPLPGSAMPSASHRLAMVEAVPMVMQEPALRDIAASAAMNSAMDMVPAATACLKRITSVPEPSALPFQRPESMGPPETMMAGRSTLAAPIRQAGVVLSQPASSTTASMGCERMEASTSMLARLRYSMVVGRISGSDSDITGNSSGKPPAS